MASSFETDYAASPLITVLSGPIITEAVALRRELREHHFRRVAQKNVASKCCVTEANFINQTDTAALSGLWSLPKKSVSRTRLGDSPSIPLLGTNTRRWPFPHRPGHKTGEPESKTVLISKGSVRPFRPATAAVGKNVPIKI